MNQAFQLFRLQRIDTSIDQNQRRITEIEVILSSDLSLMAALDQERSSREFLEKSTRDLKKIEDQVEALKIKIATTESSLYGGKIHNPKELTDLQAEIVSLKKRLSTLEDDQLNSMVEVDNAEAIAKQSKTDLIRVQAKSIEEKAGLVGEKDLLEKATAQLNEERKALITQVEIENINIYNRLREQKRGIAVVQVQDDTCTACGSGLRPAERQAARSRLSMVFCSSCGRILYAG